MKAYNTPNDELRIENDNGEELIKITSDKTTINNLGDSEDSILTIDAGVPELSPGWYGKTVHIDEVYATNEEALDALNKWESSANPKIKCIVHLGDDTATYTLSRTAQVASGGSLFFCSTGAFLQNVFMYTNMYAFPFADLYDTGFSIYVRVMYYIDAPVFD